MIEHSNKTMEIVRAVQALYAGNTFAPTANDLAKAVGRIVDVPAEPVKSLPVEEPDEEPLE